MHFCPSCGHLMKERVGNGIFAPIVCEDCENENSDPEELECEDDSEDSEG